MEEDVRNAADAGDAPEYPIRVALSRTYRVGPVEIGELEIKREPVMGDLFNLDLTPGRNQLRQMFELIARLAGAPAPLMANLNFEDGGRVSRLAERLIAPFLGTGGE